MNTSLKPDPLASVKSPVVYKTRHMRKYVGGLLVLLVLFSGSFFLAYAKVANSGQYGGEAFNSLDWKDNQKDNLNYSTP